MGRRAAQMAAGRVRARAARVERLQEQQRSRQRVDDALAVVRDSYPMSREARAVWLQLELRVGEALLELITERVLLSDVAARTGLPAGECRRLMKVARSSSATRVPAVDRY